MTTPSFFLLLLCLSLAGTSTLANPNEKPAADVRFPVPKSLKEWKQRRAKVRKTLWQLLGDLPPGPATPWVRILRKEQKDGFTLEKFEFDNEAGAVVPGYLCIPDSSAGRTSEPFSASVSLSSGRRMPGRADPQGNSRPAPAPAILYCHYHGGEYGNGKEEIFKPWPTETSPAVEFTRRGYVVMAIDAYCFGERRGKGPAGKKETGGAEELTMSKLNLWYGRTPWGMMLRDDLMALDYLCSRPEVDKKRIGVTGMSMGSTRSWWLAALDERISAAVCVACLTRYQNLVATGGLREHGIYYFVPGMLKHFDTEVVVSLIAPRPLLTLTGDRDGGSPLAGVETINNFVAEVYRLYGKDESFRGIVYPGVGHHYTPAMWQETLSWLDRWLKR